MWAPGILQRRRIEYLLLLCRAHKKQMPPIPLYVTIAVRTVTTHVVGWCGVARTDGLSGALEKHRDQASIFKTPPTKTPDGAIHTTKHTLLYRRASVLLPFCTITATVSLHSTTYPTLAYPTRPPTPTDLLHLVVGTARDVLGFVRVVSDALEHVRLEEGQHPDPAIEVPHDARSVRGSRDALPVFARHLCWYSCVCACVVYKQKNSREEGGEGLGGGMGV